MYIYIYTIEYAYVYCWVEIQDDNTLSSGEKTRLCIMPSVTGGLRAVYLCVTQFLYIFKNVSIYSVTNVNFFHHLTRWTYIKIF